MMSVQVQAAQMMQRRLIYVGEAFAVATQPQRVDGGMASTSEVESLRVQWALKRKAAKDLREEAMQKFPDALDREADALASLL